MAGVLDGAVSDDGSLIFFYFPEDRSWTENSVDYDNDLVYLDMNKKITSNVKMEN